MMLHIRHQGRSWDLEADAIGVSRASTDAEIKERIARYLEVGVEVIGDLLVDRIKNGDIVVRPQAVYG